MKTAVVALLLGVSALVLGVGGAGALPRIANPSLQDRLPHGASLADGRVTPAQYAFNTFCERYGDQCASDGKSPVVELDEGRWGELVAVNDLVNGRIEPDATGTDYDHWSLEATAGHCNEYAVQKRKELIDRGWPVAALSLAVASTRYDHGKVYHLVLTVRTDHGDLVLDNLRRRVLPASRTGYGWIMRQSAVHPRLWVRVSGELCGNLGDGAIRRRSGTARV